MNKVSVKADKTTKKAGSSTVTEKGVLKLTAMKSGSSAITPKSQSAAIEFVVDSAVVSSLKGTIEDRSGQPIFKYSSFSSLKPATQDLEDSDFFVTVGVGVGFEDDSGQNTPNSKVSFRLSLPWKMDKPNDVMKLGLRLKVGSATESDTTDNDTVDLPLQQKSVTFTGHPTGDYFGSSTVYPISSEFFTSSSTVRIGPNPLNVFFDSSSFTACKKLEPRTIAFSSFEPLLKKILTDAGFTNVSITNGAGPATWVQNKSTKKWGPSPGAAFVEVPVFDFYIFSEEGTGGTSGGEGGRSESHGTPAFDIQKGTKKLLTPIVLVTDQGGSLANSIFSVAQINQSNEMLANIVAHEIGHGLGLLHPLVFNSGKHELKAAKGVLSFSVNTTSRKDHLMFFGPVHKKTIKDLFL